MKFFSQKKPKYSSSRFVSCLNADFYIIASICRCYSILAAQGCATALLFNHLGTVLAHPRGQPIWRCTRPIPYWKKTMDQFH